MKQDCLPLNSQFQEIHLESLFNSILFNHRKTIEQNELDVWFLPSRKVPNFIYSDPNLLRLAFSEILQNSFSHTSKGEILVLINLVEQSEESVTLRINISDNGVGIPDSIMKKIEFLCQKEINSSKECGLLKCSRSVKFLSGKMGLESQLGKGTTVWFEIPVKPLFINQSSCMSVDADVVLLADKPVNRIAIGNLISQQVNSFLSIRLFDQVAEKVMELDKPIIIVNAPLSLIQLNRMAELQNEGVPVIYTNNDIRMLPSNCADIGRPITRDGLLNKINSLANNPMPLMNSEAI